MTKIKFFGLAKHVTGVKKAEHAQRAVVAGARERRNDFGVQSHFLGAADARSGHVARTEGALLKTTHAVYPGTEIPKDFRSRVLSENPETSEKREVDIWMNNPLRYAGLTFYQYQMGKDELDRSRGTSTLQVVRNPSWLTPYVGCLVVGLGLIVQFMIHLVAFVSKRRTV